MNAVWIKEEDEILKENYNKLSLNELSDKMGRTIYAIQNRATMIGIKRTNVAKYMTWTPEEKELLEKVCHEGDARYIQEKYFPDRTICSIKGALRRKEVKDPCVRHSPWTDEEIEYVINNYEFTSNIELSEKLGRSKDSIVCLARKYNLKKDYYFTKEQLKFIEDNYKTMSDHDIAKVVNHHWRVVKDRRLRMGLKHSDVVLNTGYRNLAEYLRIKTEHWRRESMTWCNYKCVITGGNFGVVHHLYGVNMIMKEVISELDVIPYKNPEEYDPEELQEILSLFDKKQSEHGFGVCLTNELHSLFHFEYGYGDNTPEQFIDFVQKHNFILPDEVAKYLNIVK